eukprot:5553084-Pyramimonas_sp.AAC.1
MGVAGVADGVAGPSGCAQVLLTPSLCQNILDTLSTEALSHGLAHLTSLILCGEVRPNPNPNPDPNPNPSRKPYHHPLGQDLSA